MSSHITEAQRQRMNPAYQQVIAKKPAADAISQDQVISRQDVGPKSALPISNGYSHIAVAGSSRVLMGNEYHGSVYNGDVVNNQSHNYTLRQRRSDETLRETARDRTLLKAAAEGQTRRVEYLIGLGADRDFVNENGLTALHFAACSGFEDTVEALLAHFVDINPRSELFGTPICLAAAYGRQNVFRILLEARVNIHADAGGFGSLLHAACSGGIIDIVESLLGTQFPLEMTRTINYGVVDVSMSSEEVASTLLRKEYRLRASVTPLQVATLRNHTELVAFLIDRGADVNSTYESWSVRKDPDTPLDTEQHELRQGGKTALMLAANRGYCDISRLLLQAGADPGAKDDWRGWTALHRAAVHGHLECLGILIQGNAIINVVDHDGATPIAWAALFGHDDCVNYLAVQGADLEISDRQDWTPLMKAALKGHLACLKSLLSKGASMETRDNEGYTAIALAVSGIRVDCVEYLAKHGANVGTQNNAGWTPLLIAAVNGQLDCLKLLVKSGASVAKQGPFGYTALRIASDFGHTECIQYLVPDIEIRDANGYTPLLEAAFQGSIAGVKALIDLGANLKAKDIRGKTAAKLAKEQGHKEIVKMLEEAMKR